MAILELAGIQAGYGAVKVLDGINLQVAEGEVVALLGPNGAGKTTIAETISGAIRAWSGTISFDGQMVTGLSPERRARLGMILVPQGRRVFPDLTVTENLAVALNAARGRASADSRDFISEVFPKLATLSRRLAGSLSGGEQQMLAVARALMAEPRLITFDEPSLGLAPVVVDDLFAAIAAIRARGVVVLLIEQMVGPALSVADRVHILESGRIVDSGAPADFTSAEALAARYLGAG